MGNNIIKQTFKDKKEPFKSMDELNASLKELDFTKTNLIFGIDFTASNKFQGRKTNDNKCLHFLDSNGKILNQYQTVIQFLGRYLTKNKLIGNSGIRCYGFGDSNTTDTAVFSLKSRNNDLCRGYKDVLSCYKKTVPKVTLSGPTNFRPIIDKAVEIVKKTKNEHHVLVIIADGGVCECHWNDTIKSLRRASNYPLSIITVGVGDGPFPQLDQLANSSRRLFDNLGFVNFNEVVKNVVEDCNGDKQQDLDEMLALKVMMDIPRQIIEMNDLGILVRNLWAEEKKNRKKLSNINQKMEKYSYVKQKYT